MRRENLISYRIPIKMDLFSATTQMYYLTSQINVSVTVSSHHQADPKFIKERNNTPAILLVKDLGPCNVYNVRDIYIYIYIYILRRNNWV
jgi:hypothetical protein